MLDANAQSTVTPKTAAATNAGHEVARTLAGMLARRRTTNARNTIGATPRSSTLTTFCPTALVRRLPSVGRPHKSGPTTDRSVGATR